MFNDILGKENVTKLLKELVNNDRYNKKNIEGSIDYLRFIDNELALFIAMDALYKYKIIIDDKDLLNDFVEQLNLLFRKIDNLGDITTGINRLITKFVVLKLGYKDKEEEKKQEIINYVYDKYINNGYIFHAINDVYENDIRRDGFVPQNYNNLYKEFIEVQNLIGKDILDKDFNSDEVSFTDSFEMAYFYAVNSPIYFYKLLCDNELIIKLEDKKAYLYNSYEDSLKNINKIINKLELSDEKGSKVKEVFDKEWNLINRTNYCPTIMAIKRNLVLKDSGSLYNSINYDLSLSEVIGKIINSKYNDIKYSNKIDSSNIEFIKVPSYNSLKIKKENNNKEVVIKEENKISNDLGKVSILLLVGSLLVTLGVIITIVMTMMGG